MFYPFLIKLIIAKVIITFFVPFKIAFANKNSFIWNKKHKFTTLVLIAHYSRTYALGRYSIMFYKDEKLFVWTKDFHN